MANPVWMKIKEVEPGLYWYGGIEDKPTSQYKSVVLIYDGIFNRRDYGWYARIGNMPPEPVMPLPDLKSGDPVMVWDTHEDNRSRAHFAGWGSGGKVLTWKDGTEWASEGDVFGWKHWRLPTEEELAE